MSKLVLIYYYMILWFLLWLPWITADFLSYLLNSNVEIENQLSLAILAEDYKTAYRPSSVITTSISFNSSFDLDPQNSQQLYEMETGILVVSIKIQVPEYWRSDVQNTVSKYISSCYRIAVIIILLNDDNKNLTKSILNSASEWAQKESNSMKDIYIIFELDSNNIIMWELYNVKYNVIAKMFEIEDNNGTIFDHEVLCSHFIQDIYRTLPRRQNLRNIQLQAHFKVEADSLLDVTAVESNGEWIPQNGLSMQVLNDLRVTLNFSVNLTLGVAIKRWPNQTLKGRSSQSLQSGHLDLFISVTSLLPYRQAYVSFLQPTLRTKVVACFIQPSSSSVRNIYTCTFHMDTWITICSITLLTVIVMRLIYISSSLNNLQDIDKDNSFQGQLLIWGLGIMAQQGWYLCPKSIPSRIAFLTGYVFGYLCYVAYTAAIVAILAVAVIPIGSFNELLGSKLQILVDNDSTTMVYFLEGLRKEKNRENIALGYSPIGAMSKIFAYKPSSLIGTTQLMYHTIQKLDFKNSWICDHLTMLPASKDFIPYAMVVPKKSHFAELFNYKIMRMIEIGLLQRNVEHHNRKIQIYCLPKPTSRYDVLELKDVYTAFVLIFFGGILSIGILFFEKFHFTHNQFCGSKHLHRTTTTLTLS